MTDKNGQSPLHLVAKTGDVEASIVLLEGDATVDAMDKVRLLEKDRRSYLHSILKF